MGRAKNSHAMKSKQDSNALGKSLVKFDVFTRQPRSIYDNDHEQRLDGLFDNYRDKRFHERNKIRYENYRDKRFDER
ncbi:unnamed protein product [Gordionus sp. m RMFG-2023]